MGDNIRFAIPGKTCPDADNDWYAAQLDAEIHITTQASSSYRSLVMFSDDATSLERLLSGHTGCAMLESGDFLSVQIRVDGDGYRCWTQLDALELEGEMIPKEKVLRIGDGVLAWIEPNYTSCFTLPVKLAIATPPGRHQDPEVNLPRHLLPPCPNPPVTAQSRTRR